MIYDEFIYLFREERKKLRTYDLILPKFHLILPKFHFSPRWKTFILHGAIWSFLGRDLSRRRSVATYSFVIAMCSFYYNASALVHL